MNEMIERYINVVVKRLPEKERIEIERELRANIYDMLPENYTQADVIRVLKELGDPVTLSEKYRTKPRYLISPAYYDTYINILKIVLPIVGIVLLAIAAIGTTIGLLMSGDFKIPDLFIQAIPSGIGGSFEGMIQAFFLITVGFAIAERCGAKPDKETKAEWKPEELPPIVKKTNKTIPLSDCIAEIIFTFIATFIGVSYFSGWILTKGIIIIDGNRISDIFSPEFSRAVIPVIIIVALMNLVKSSLRITFRKWNIIICAVTVLTSIIGAVISINLLASNPMFSTSFLELMSSLGLNQVKNIPFLADGNLNIVANITIVVIVFSTVVEVITAIVKTFVPERQLK